MKANKLVAFVGFGEAGRAFAQGVRPQTDGIVVHDIKFQDDVQAPSLLSFCSWLGVSSVIPSELGQAGMVFCLVTADQAIAAAREIAPHLSPGALWLDGNSCAPSAKRQAAQAIEAAGACYVDMAVMAPVLPRLHRTPVLISGPHAQRALPLIEELGMQVQIVGQSIGDASAIKMLRSVIVKGTEALLAEALLAARRVGVEDAVLASLQASDPSIDWAQRGAYCLERMLVHGTRRAAEMKEVSATLRDLGMPDAMSRATTEWQAWLGSVGLESGSDSLAARLDTILNDLP